MRRPPSLLGDFGDLGDLGDFGDFGDLGDLGDLGDSGGQSGTCRIEAVLCCAIAENLVILARSWFFLASWRLCVFHALCLCAFA